jgi:hypothetical protein
MTGDAGADQTSAAATMVAIMETLLKKKDKEPAYGKAYPLHDLEKVFAITKVVQPWDGLGEQYLPVAYQGLKPYRSSQTAARGYLESHYNKMYPPRPRDKHTFLLEP